jgi:hypothetical protein
MFHAFNVSGMGFVQYFPNIYINAKMFHAFNVSGMGFVQYFPNIYINAKMFHAFNVSGMGFVQYNFTIAAGTGMINQSKRHILLNSL